MHEEVKSLLDLKVIKLTHRRAQQVISPVFLRKKKISGFRLVLDLEELKKHIPYKHFEMGNLNG